MKKLVVRKKFVSRVENSNVQNVGARCIVPTVNENNAKTGRAQFIVPLQIIKTVGKPSNKDGLDKSDPQICGNNIKYNKL